MCSKASIFTWYRRIDIAGHKSGVGGVGGGAWKWGHCTARQPPRQLWVLGWAENQNISNVASVLSHKNKCFPGSTSFFNGPKIYGKFMFFLFTNPRGRTKIFFVIKHRFIVFKMTERITQNQLTEQKLKNVQGDKEISCNLSKNTQYSQIV